MNNNKFEDFKKYCLGKKGKEPLFGKNKAFQSERGLQGILKKDEESEMLNVPGNSGRTGEILKDVMGEGTNTPPQEGANKNYREGAKEKPQEEVFPLSKLQLVTLLKNCQSEKNALRYELDLLKLKLSHPDLTCQKIEELGEEFLTLLSKGISLEDAFSLSQKKRPKSLGPVKSDVKRQDYIPKDVAKKMSKKEIEENFDLIQNSMKHWG